MMTAKRGLPLNERPDFIEVSRRAGYASVEAKRRIKARKAKITEVADVLFNLRPTLDELSTSYLLAYVEVLQRKQAAEDARNGHRTD